MDRDELIRTTGGEVIAIEDAIVQGLAALQELHDELSVASGDSEALAELVATALENPDRLQLLSVVYGEDRDGWEASVMRCKSVKGASRIVGRLEKAVRRRSVPVRLAGDHEGIEAPDGIPDGWEVPEGFRMDQQGVWRLDLHDGDRRLTTQPLWVVGRLVDVDDGSCLVRMAWPGWSMSLREEVVPRAEVADSRRLIGLADKGAPITSANARELTSFIDAATSVNHGRLPVAYVVGRCGWVKGGFLHGKVFVGPPPAVSLHAEDGTAQLAKGLAQRGSWKGWCQAMETCQHLPSPWLAVYASVASVLLHYLGIHNGFIVDWSGETSRGKTTTLRVGLSVWGRPDEHGLLGTWKATANGLERRASFFHHIPLGLDDTKQAEASDEARKKVRDMLYAYASGSGKLRAKIDGLRRTETWLGALLTCGEQPATSFTQDAGARARTLSIVGSPFDTRANAEAVTVGVLDNYGHLGRRVIEHLLQDGRQEQYRAEYALAKEQHLAALADEGAVAGRLAAVVAAIDVAGDVVAAVGAPRPHEDPVELALQAARNSSQDADRPAAALRFLYELAVSSPTSFYGRHLVDTSQHGAGDPIVPHGGWAGRWDKGELEWHYIAFMPSWAKTRLDRAGFDVDGTLQRWKERGWLRGKGRGRTMRVRIDGAFARCLCVKRDVVLEVAGVR